jgi:LacI family transcriptional regulator
MATRPTIYDVARHAGVGAKTVSRVLNGEPDVSATMRDRVQQSIRALGYRPNSAARVLRRSIARSVGFVCEDIGEPVQARLTRAIEAVTRAQDCALTVSLTHHDPLREQAVIESLMARRVDGLVLWPTGTPSRYLRRLVDLVPLVCVDRPVDGVATDTVLCDNRVGAGLAVDFLYRQGHRRISFVGDSAELFTQTERLAGYRQALQERGIDVDQQIIYQADQDAIRLRRQLTYWRNSPRPPTAVVAASSVAAGALLRALSSDDPMAVVAFDDFPLADVVRGGVTVVAQDVDTIGRIAAERLFERLTGADRRDAKTIRVAPTLTERS